MKATTIIKNIGNLSSSSLSVDFSSTIGGTNSGSSNFLLRKSSISFFYIGSSFIKSSPLGKSLKIVSAVS